MKKIITSEDIDIMGEAINKIRGCNFSLIWNTKKIKVTSKLNKSKLKNINWCIKICNRGWNLAKKILNLENTYDNKLKYYFITLKFHVTVWPNSTTWFRQYKKFLNNEKNR